MAVIGDPSDQGLPGFDESPLPHKTEVAEETIAGARDSLKVNIEDGFIGVILILIPADQQEQKAEDPPKRNEASKQTNKPQAKQEQQNRATESRVDKRPCYGHFCSARS